MRVKVLNTFSDNKNKHLYLIGQEIDITKEEFEKYNSTLQGLLVEEVKEEKKPAKKKEK